MSDTAPPYPQPMHRGAARLAARLAILGALLFLGVAGGLQLVRDDLAWQQATLSQYLLGPYGLLLRTMYCLLAVAIVALAMGLYVQLAPRARSAAPVLLLSTGALALAGVAIGDSWLPQVAPDFHRMFHPVCAITAFLCVVSGMVLQAWRFRLDAAWRHRFPLAATWSVACFVLLWVHALWPPAGHGWVQKLLVALIVSAMLLAGAWLHRAIGRADDGVGR
ncbi:DUF998 domain-containing protein [Pseudoxanthomonas sp. F37]|nr:DUF998 domain-containing protein [Pseudoxanthomonas sp. F37]UOV07287.1 DUF998 domain-containing protein [Pseudoxanthomonas sp. F37]